MPAPQAQEICRQTLLEKYAAAGERSVAEVQRRVARALALVETAKKRVHWEKKFLAAMTAGFVPPAGSTPPPARDCTRLSSTASCSRWGIQSPASATAGRASTWR